MQVCSFKYKDKELNAFQMLLLFKSVFKILGSTSRFYLLLYKFLHQQKLKTTNAKFFCIILWFELPGNQDSYSYHTNHVQLTEILFLYIDWTPDDGNDIATTLSANIRNFDKTKI